VKLIVLDAETSDLPERGGQLLELAWMVLDGNKPVSAKEFYVQFNGLISPVAQASNHITIQDCSAARGAKPKEDVLRHLVQDLEPDTFLVAHNYVFDSKFIPPFTNPWICTFRVSKCIWPEAPGHANQVLRYWLGIKPDLSLATNIKPRGPHQALYDVATTTGILLKMLERHTPEELHKMTVQPYRLAKIPFGKHKGTDFDKIPIDYLRWLRQQSNLDPDVKYTLDSIL
jgi:exodeoxyribonuclease X